MDLVVIYPGRFQPYSAHHHETYKKLVSKYGADKVYIVTSDKVALPKSPLNFNEKKKIMVKMGVPANKIFKVKSPYNPTELKSKLSDDTAVLFGFGKKDASRLVSGKYFLPYKGNEKKLEPHADRGYYIELPHVSIKVDGKELSGTQLRDFFGSFKYEGKREALFKKIYGFFDQKIFNLLTAKFDLKEILDIIDVDIINEFLTTIDMKGIINEASPTTVAPVDDGPPTFYKGFEEYKIESTAWLNDMYNAAGWKILNHILSDGAEDPAFDETLEYNIVPVTAYGKIGSKEGYSDPIGKYREQLTRIVGMLGWEIMDWLGTSGKTTTGVDVQAPAYGGVGADDNVKNTTRAQEEADDWPSGETKTHTITEDITIPVNIGDTILTGKFKNKKTVVKDIGVDEHGMPTINGRKVATFRMLPLAKEWWETEIQKEILLEGGAYGHMSHPFDENDLTFGDLRKIIDLGLQGKLDKEEAVQEKLDGQNLMVSWIDGKIMAARNKGDIKRGGIDLKAITAKFEGRGAIKDAFVFGMTDLGKAMAGLSDKQRDKIFDNGKNWMNLEVIWPASKNVIDYDAPATIILHGALKYDDSGAPIDEVKGSGSTLANMIKQINQHVQDKYAIRGPNIVKVAKAKDYTKRRAHFFSKLDKLRNKYGLTDKDTVALYHQAYWNELILNSAKKFKYNIPKTILVKLIKRWAFFDKSYSIRNIKKDFEKQPKFLEWVLKTDKEDHKHLVKDNMRPFEILFFEVGAEILKNVSNWLSVSPDKTVQTMKKDVEKAISELEKSADPAKIKRFKTQLDRFNTIGGAKAIIPAEGIVFKYQGKMLKFTGSFAPTNQILGLLW